MKYTNFLLIFSCMTVMLTVSCEQSDLRKSEGVSSQVVETRSIDDCEECPVEDCCCTIEIIDNSVGGIPPMTLTLCGTTTPGTTAPCSQSSLGSCNDIINGFIEFIPFDAMNKRAIFCATLNQTFGITSALPFLPGVTIAITCQNGIFPPQTVYVDLGSLGNKPYWELGADCVLGPCF